MKTSWAVFPFLAINLNPPLIGLVIFICNFSELPFTFFIIAGVIVSIFLFLDTFWSTLINPSVHPKFKGLSIPEHLRVYLKTGTLGSLGVSNCAGFIYDTRTETYYSFVILAQSDNKTQTVYRGTLTDPILKDILATL